MCSPLPDSSGPLLTLGSDTRPSLVVVGESFMPLLSGDKLSLFPSNDDRLSLLPSNDS